MGFLGPVAIKIPLAIDRSVAVMPTVDVVGGNATDIHLKGVVPGRDFLGGSEPRPRPEECRTPAIPARAAARR